MRIYTGSIFTDLVSDHRANLPIFEDMFKDRTSAEYGACWDLVMEDIVVKTNDALRCAPEDATIVKVSRSVRKADLDAIIEVESSLSEFLFIDPAAPTDRRAHADQF